ncbi:hypothetical protein [Candidatus Cyanaurora vandensis]|uniref:hypothetical protein n=1 Tax=Candidatus Cyanaurora vandensis TaxID=2714958 RepID=UPI00257C4810|nr:hypothetical protein [Candidatus Cyanaurora vandensis]
MYLNPYYFYSLAFGLVLVLYNLGWASIYPVLAVELVSFLLITFLVSALLGYIVSTHRHLKYVQLPKDPRIGLMVILIYFVSLVDVIAARIPPPLFQSLLLITEDSKEFINNYGIPLVHPVLLCLTVLFCIYTFHLFLSQRRKRYLLYCGLLYLPLIIFFSRGTIAIGFISSLFIYFFHLKSLSWRTISGATVAVLGAAYVFGLSGNLRTGDDNFLLDVTGATPAFTESLIPKEYYWSYIYITSPMANFQLNARRSETVGIRDFGVALATSTVIPLFVGKYIIRALNPKIPQPRLITSALTTGTTYVVPYIFLDWLGPGLMFIYLMAFLGFFLKFFRPDNPFYVSGLALLNTVVLLSIFDNMVSFTGTVVPLIMAWALGGIYQNLRPRW